MRWSGTPGRKVVMVREIGDITIELWVLDGTYEVKTARYGVRLGHSLYPQLWEEAKAEFEATVRRQAATYAAAVMGAGDDT